MNKTIIFATALLLILGLYLIKSKTSVDRGNLAIEVLEEGSGRSAENKDRLTVHYTGWLEDGTQFDSSLDRGQPFIFTLGVGQVIPGWDEGMLGAKVGEKRKLTIPPSLAYGQQGSGSIIPPNATLIFEVEIINIQ